MVKKPEPKKAPRTSRKSSGGSTSKASKKKSTDRRLDGVDAADDRSPERRRFDALLAEVKALGRGGTSPGRPTKWSAGEAGRSWGHKGWVPVDVAVLLLVVYALLTGTPVGALAFGGWAWITGATSEVRPLLSYFSQPGRAKDRLQTLQKALRRGRSIRRNGQPIRDPLPDAVAFLFADGRVEGEHFDVRLPEPARQALLSVAVSWPGDAATAEQRQRALLRGLERLRRHLAADEAAVAALRVDPESLDFALQRAKVSGAEFPGRFEAFGRFLGPEDRRTAGRLVNAAFALSGAYSMTWPIAGLPRVTSRFGPRTHPVLGRRRMHHGIDLGVRVGTPVLAAQAGRVTFVGADAVNGRFLRIDHGHGLTTTYCHLDRHRVKRNAQVDRGDHIADSGNSGRSTGPHLHFQVEFGGTPVDPEMFH